MTEKIAQLAAIVGRDHVIDDLATTDAYSRDQSFAPPKRPSLIVRPVNVDEVQAIVRWANQACATLIPVSSGPPHFHGDTVPTAAGAVVVDLSRMKRIIRVDRRNRIAIFEPGVTYDELQPELAKEGLRLSTPLLPRRSKSVLASLLEREPTLIPKYQWTLMEPLRCLEVVWGAGSRMWTGEAGEYSSTDLAEQERLHRAAVVGMGPANVDYYRLISAAQGTMGIVTWASVKCDVLPQLHKLFIVPADSLDRLIDCAYSLLRIRLGDETLIVNRAELASMLGKGPDAIKQLKAQLPPWALLIGIAGREFLPQERVEFQQQDIAEVAGRYGLKLMPAIPGAEGSDILQRLLTTSRGASWKLDYKGACQDIFFLTTLDRTPQFLTTMRAAADALAYDSSDIGVYLQPLHQGTSCHCEFSLPYAADDPAAAHQVQELFARASNDLLKAGAFFSRPYGMWADMMYRNDSQYTRLLKNVKGLFDPNNVLNPGKLCFKP